MGVVVGEPFEDYGNAGECTVTRLSKWEYLGGELFRLFLCKTFNGRNQLDHTTLMVRADMRALGKALIEIAERGGDVAVPDWAIEIGSKLAS